MALGSVMSNGNGKFGSRRFIMAVFVEGVATAVLFASIVALWSDFTKIMPSMNWWMQVSGGVLVLYGANKVIDKMGNGGGR